MKSPCSSRISLTDRSSAHSCNELPETSISTCGLTGATLRAVMARLYGSSTSTCAQSIDKAIRSPHLIIVATDANCKGWYQRIRDFGDPVSPAPIVHAIPDPHIERWLLLDGAAFKSVFGRGCDAPDRKYDRNRYRQRLQAIFAAGITPNLGGTEFADEVVQQMDIGRAEQADDSFRRFVGSLRATYRGWNS